MHEQDLSKNIMLSRLLPAIDEGISDFEKLVHPKKLSGSYGVRATWDPDYPNRGYCERTGAHTSAVSLGDGKRGKATVTHELGHSLENDNAQHLREAVEFLEDKTKGKMKILTKGPPPEIRKDWKYKGSRANLNEEYEYKYMTKFYWHPGPKRPFDVTSKNGTHHFDGTELTSMALEHMAGDYPHYFAEDARDLFDFIFRRVIHPVEYAVPAPVKKRWRPADSDKPREASLV